MNNQKNKPENGAACGQSTASCSLPDPNFIVSLSGGKDSTAMLHWMLESGENIHSVVFFDTGWEFPAMLDHVDLVEKKTGIEVVRIKSQKSFHHWMFNQRVIARKGPMKGRVHRIGNGWPSPSRRWCTSQKVDAMKQQHIKHVENAVSCVGFAYDELHRLKGDRYPLVEYGKTEADCLKKCEDLGYHWGGLYDVFKRVSCFCCPLQGLDELRSLRKHYPELWEKMLEWDMAMPSNRGFRGYNTVVDMERRFTIEDAHAAGKEIDIGAKDRQMNMWTA